MNSQISVAGNITEAQVVAEAAVTFMAGEPEKSLGIVTLNQPQRDVLLEEMERRVAHERSAQQYVEQWEGTLESVFVRNLENVQGDERDVIFISTVYGPDAATGLVMNRFGPINGIHGHRRLNVLFTHPRTELRCSRRCGRATFGQGRARNRVCMRLGRTSNTPRTEASSREI